MMPRYIIQLIDAGHDVNGNPRRAFVVYDVASGHHCATIDEGYNGTRAVASEIWDASSYIGDLKVSAGTYRAMLRKNRPMGGC